MIRANLVTGKLSLFPNCYIVTHTLVCQHSSYSTDRDTIYLKEVQKEYKQAKIHSLARIRKWILQYLLKDSSSWLTERQSFNRIWKGSGASTGKEVACAWRTLSSEADLRFHSPLQLVQASFTNGRSQVLLRAQTDPLDSLLRESGWNLSLPSPRIECDLFLSTPPPFRPLFSDFFDIR